MFEKKAEEYANGKGHEHYNYLFEENAGSPVDFARLCFKDGAEFGYNKANEWHYVKDGDFPKNRTEEKYLVALESEYGGFFYETDIWCESLHCFASNNPTKVYAWKEIVLPKE